VHVSLDRETTGDLDGDTSATDADSLRIVTIDVDLPDPDAHIVQQHTLFGDIGEGNIFPKGAWDM